MSDIPWDGGAFPDGLAAALSDRSVSNPSVIDDLVGGFVQEVSDLADNAAYAGAENHPLPDVMSYVATTLLGTPSLEQVTGSRDRS